jgi:hypothetical protein
MKKRTIISISALSLLLAGACTKTDFQSQNVETLNPQSATVTIDLAASTKSVVEQTQQQDNAINTLDVFIFKNTDQSNGDSGELDTYQRFQGDDLSSIQLTSTTGPKVVCVVANSHVDDFSGVTKIASFKELKTLLKNEMLGSFTMYGEVEHEFELTNRISVTLTRFVSKVAVTSIKTKFDGTSYQGQTLKNCKLFLINAYGDKLVFNNENGTSPIILNQAALVEEDVNSTAQEGLLMDVIDGDIDGTGHSTAHYFYTYSNETENISTSTKVVLQADLNGVTYYYPIMINQPDYGYLPENGHYGVGRNTSYSYTITVTRPGSEDPNIPLVPGAVELTLEVQDWSVVPSFDKEF